MSVDKAILEGIADDLNQAWRLRMVWFHVYQRGCNIDSNGDPIPIYRLEALEKVGDKSRIRLRIVIIDGELKLE